MLYSVILAHLRRRHCLDFAAAVGTALLLLFIAPIAYLQPSGREAATGHARPVLSTDTYARAERLLRDCIDGLLWNGRTTSAGR